MKTVIRTQRMLLIDAIILDTEDSMNAVRSLYRATGSKIEKAAYRRLSSRRDRAVGLMKKAFYAANPA